MSRALCNTTTRSGASMFRVLCSTTNRNGASISVGILNEEIARLHPLTFAFGMALFAL